MRILLTNDDGIYAPGLQALRKELLKLGDVVVCAPATEQSAAGHSVTLLWPLIVQEVVDDTKQYWPESLSGGCDRLIRIDGASLTEVKPP